MEAKKKIVQALVENGILPDNSLLTDIEQRLKKGEDPESLEKKLLNTLASSPTSNQSVNVEAPSTNLESALNHETTSNQDLNEATSIIPKTKQEQDLYDTHLTSGTQTTTTTPNTTPSTNPNPTPNSTNNTAQKESNNNSQTTTTQDNNENTQINHKAILAMKKQQEAHEVNLEQDTIFEESKPMSLDDIPNIEDEPEITYEITTHFEHKPYKYKVQDFTNFFRSRLKFLEKVIRQHPEMKSVTSINRVLQKKEKEEVAIIGTIFDIAKTKNDNFIITIEDLTGQIKVIITKNNKDAYEQAGELIFDEVVGITGSNSQDIIFGSNIVWPDVPAGKQIKKAKTEEYAIFLSDIHVGSTYFLKNEFQKFIEWMKAETGSDRQKEIAKNVKYIFIAGDVVDGIGIYQGQDKELTHTTMEGQYAEFTKYIKQIPTDKKIFICPGNHDLVHLAEPQSKFYKEYTQELHELPNVELVSNPSMVTIAKTNEFDGINVLMYHGYSFDFYVANVDQIRNNGGYHRADLIMKFLLKRRHLAPAFKSTPYLPAHKEDPLLIKKVPDIMISGHIHYSSVAHYKGVTMICGSCWQGKTDFQEKLGHTPEPGRVPIVNLKTREVKVLRFM